MLKVGASSHGESRLRLLRVLRRGDRHDPRDLEVAIRLEGAPASAFLDGAATLVPGASLQAAVHRVARANTGSEVETFALALAAHLLETYRQVTRVRLDVMERAWQRLDVGGKAQGQAFSLGSPELRTVAITSNGQHTAVVAGIDRLTLMRSSGLLPRRTADARADDGTEDAVPGLLVGGLTVKWTYSNADVTFGPYRQGVRAAVVDTFAMHASRSVPFTLYAIADVVLAAYDEILDVTLGLQEHPYRAADPFADPAAGRDDLFVSADAPVGVVEVTVERNGGGTADAARPKE